ncbi:putative holin-like toxin [Lacticaseibacillus daqingensis]|nr:putative holin-like toxin [Lacticaseibacillus daqingensis]
MVSTFEVLTLMIAFAMLVVAIINNNGQK